MKESQIPEGAATRKCKKGRKFPWQEWGEILEEPRVNTKFFSEKVEAAAIPAGSWGFLSFSFGFGFVSCAILHLIFMPLFPLFCRHASGSPCPQPQPQPQLSCSTRCHCDLSTFNPDRWPGQERPGTRTKTEQSGTRPVLSHGCWIINAVSVSAFEKYVVPFLHFSVFSFQFWVLRSWFLVQFDLV